MTQVSDSGLKTDGRKGDQGFKLDGTQVKKDGPGVKLDGTKPTEAGPDQMGPDMAAPDMAKPDMAVPDLPQPDQMQPDQMQPDLMQPDTYLPPVSCAITYPTRAAMLTGSASLTIQGKITGAQSSLSTVKVNGQLVTPTSTGTFSLPVTSVWGLNIITLECTDKNQNIERKAQSYHYSTKYYAMNPTSPATQAVPQGALGRLYQKAIDDGDRTTLNDLATILEKVINATDLDAQIPSTLVSGKISMPWPLPDISYDAKKNGKLTYSPIKISLKTRSGGLAISGSTSSMSLPVKASAAGISVSGTVTINNFSLAGDIDISKSSGGTVQVSVPKLTVSYSSITVNLGSGLVSQALSAITNGVVSLFKNTIISKFETEIKKVIPDPVKKFISGFSLSQSFTLPAELGSKKLSIYSVIDQIAFDGYGGNLTLNAAVYGTKGITDGKLGSISVAGTHTPPSTSTNAMEVALRYDVLNQALCATWYTGALKLDLSKTVMAALNPSTLPFQIQSLKFEVEAMLPPLLQPGTKGYDFDLAVGDLWAKASVTLPGTPSATIVAELYASAVTGGTVSLSSSNEITFSLASTLTTFEPEVILLSIQGTNLPSLGAITLLLKELVTKALPSLAPNILQKFPIPSIDLSTLGGSYGIPSGTIITLKNGKLVLKNNHAVMSGELK